MPKGASRSRTSSAASRPERVAASTSPESRRSVSLATRSRISSRATTIAACWTQSRSKSPSSPERCTTTSQASADPARGRDRMCKRPAPQVGLVRHEWRRRRAARLHLLADRVEQVLGELAAAARQDLAARVEHHRAAADGSGDLSRDLVEAAALEDQPLEPLVHRDTTGEHVVLVVHQPAERRLGDRDEWGLVGDLEDREVAPVGLAEQRLRDLGVVEAGAEAESGDAGIGEEPDELPLQLGVVERDARGEQKLAAREPGRRVEQLCDVHPANLALARSLLPGQDLETELRGQALDGEHHCGDLRAAWRVGAAAVCPTRRDASSRVGRRTSTISSNCSVSAISGGENWTTGSPRSSARQISPRR